LTALALFGLVQPERAAAADPVIAAAGDIACGARSTGGSCKQKATSDILVGLDGGGGLSAVLPLGDIQYECGELSNFRSYYDPTWGRLKSKTRPVVGNHEYSTAPSNTSCEPSNTQSGAPGYFRYYGQAATPLDPSCTANCRGYYSFDLGSWHLIALNSNCSRVGGCSAGSAQETWLKDDLARTSKSCILAYWHAPRYSSGGRQTDSVQGLWAALYDAHADVVLTGHDHTYERFAKAGRGTSTALDPVADSRGIRQFVVGSGGRNHTSFTTIRSLSEVRNSDTFGVLRMTLRPTSYEWRFMPEAGKSFSDSGTNSCNPKSSSPPSDTTPPSASITEPVDGATVTGTIDVSANASDDVGVADVRFKLDGGNLGAADTTPPYSIAWDTATVANGSHTVTAVARDAAGNTSPASTVSVTVDNPTPSPSPISLVRQATGSVVGGTSLVIPVQPTAAGNALVASIAVAAGSSKSVTAVSDSAGGSWTKGPVGFQSGSNTRVETWFRAGAPGGISSVNATLSASATAAGNVSEWSGVVTAAPLDGQAGRGNASSTTTSTPPLTTLNADDVVVGALNYQGSAGAALAAGAFTPLSSFAVGTTNGRAAYRIVSSPGTYQASWTLPSATTSGTAILALKGTPLPPADTTPPTVSVTNPAAGNVTGTVQLRADASDSGGVAGVRFEVDGSPVGAEDTTAPYEVDWDTTTLANGSVHAVTAIATDAAGNSATSTAVSVTVDNAPVPDTTPPTVSITAPLDGEPVQGSQVVRASASDNVGVVGVQFRLDGDPVGPEDVDAPYSVDWDTSAGTEGAHTITAVARDAAGFETVSTAVNVTVDNTDPTVSITAPDGTAPLSGTVSVEANAFDTGGSGVASVQFKLDDADLGSPDTTEPYSTTWDTTTAANGPHMLTAVAVDAAGNVASSAAVAVAVFNAPLPDTTNPTVAVTAPAEGDNVRGTVNLAASADDNVGVIGVQFTVDGQDVGAEDTSAPYTASWDTGSGVADGSHTVAALARDAAGNSNSASVQVTVDNTAPTTSITNPAAGPVSGTVDVQAEAADPGGSGIASVRFELDGTPVGSPDATAPYSTSWDTTSASTGTHTVQAIATDNAGNTTTSSSVTVTVDNTPPAPAVSFVGQATASITSGTSLQVPVSASAAGNTLVASIAVATGSSKSVASVSDSAAGAWTKGPVGFLTGSNTRVELWFRAGAPAGITSVTATLSASAAASANVSEWAGVASTSPVGAQASRGNASSTVASTPSVTTTGAGVVIAAVNYLGSMSSTLTTSGMTSLTSFSVGTTNGRAAYRIVSGAGSESAAWALTSAAPSGAAILSLKAG
jgi:Big-like domain-containing protein/calcineurin-like phosphoesterase family protein